jgi:hypothetical protein
LYGLLGALLILAGMVVSILPEGGITAENDAESKAAVLEEYRVGE